jgi:glycosyltransferase involved in cell wall biosynthesis
VAEDLLFIGHPLLPQPGKENISFCSYYKKGEEIKKKYFKNFGPRFSFHYAENILLSVFWVIRSGRKWDLLIGVNNLNTLSGLILKLLGRVKKVTFYVVDYAPQRFENPIVNYIYHLVDKVAVLFADEVWFLSPRMINARAQFKRLEVNKKKSKIVPMGIWFAKIRRASFDEIDRHTLVFMGHLLKKQGVQEVINAIPKIAEKVPSFKFLIIGKGEYRSVLESIVEEKNLGDRVVFAGHIESHQEMEELMSKSACAVALYEKGDWERNFTYYADPGKIKDYLGAGLPVILTDVPHNAFEIEKHGCGVVVDDNKEAVAEAVIKIMSDERKLKEYRKNALNFAGNYDWNKIFSEAFS